MSQGKRVVRAFASPLVRYFDNRFREVHEQLAERLEQVSRQQEQLSRQVESVNESLGKRVAEAQRSLAEDIAFVPRGVAHEVAQHVDASQTQVRDDVAIMSELALVVERFAERFAMRAEELTARIEALAGTTGDEHVVELPFAYAAAAGLPVGARVLTVGTGAGRLAISLASLGLEVTAVDHGQLPVEHPNLRVVTSALADWEGPPSPVAAIFWLSTLDEADTDRVLERFHTWLVPGGELVFSLPNLDAECLAKPVADWETLETRVYVRSDPFIWAPHPGDDDPGREDDRAGITLVRLTSRP